MYTYTFAHALRVFPRACSRLEGLMSKVPFGDSLIVSDFAYVAAPLRLGSLAGNRFTITLRDIDCDAEAALAALSALRERGFVNYFGLQRFGSNVDAATHRRSESPSLPLLLHVCVCLYM